MTRDKKICNVCLRTLKLSRFRVANGHRGRSDTCKECENEGRLFTCTKCGAQKSAYEMATDSRKTNGLHSWCRECKKKSVNANHNLMRARFGSEIPEHRKKAKAKPKMKPTALYKATPKKPRAEWTEEERKRYLRVLLDPERRAKAAELRKGIRG